MSPAWPAWPSGPTGTIVRDASSISKLASLSYIKAWNPRYVRKEEISFAKIMFDPRYSRPSDKRDHIFGVRTWSTRLDGTQYALKLGGVYLNTTLRLIDEASILRALSAAGIGFFGGVTLGLEGSLSWTPDWSRHPGIR